MKLDGRSMYQQAHDAILAYVEENRGKIDSLPSELEFSKMLGVSRNTVREAIRILEREGILYSRHGVGTFIIHSKRELSTCISTLESATKIIKDHGYEPGTFSVKTDICPADTRIGKYLDIPEGAPVFYIERVRTADGEPVVLVRDYIPYQPEMEDDYKSSHTESLLDFLQENYNIAISHVICEIKAEISDEELERCLQLDRQCALLVLEQIHFDNKGKAAFYSDSYFLSEKFHFNVIRKKI